ncbi:hypothetical protein HA466_0008920 [Hirschfeldia incana]|nr:hypothetical protein HA466_0008920 [Hirschfeldia incana]
MFTVHAEIIRYVQWFRRPSPLENHHHHHQLIRAKERYLPNLTLRALDFVNFAELHHVRCFYSSLFCFLLLITGT